MALNRYAKLRRHKRYLKQRHANAYNRWNIHDDEQREKESAEDYPWRYSRSRRNGGYWYWENCYLSGRRKHAKACTNRRIRAKYRNLMLRRTNPEYLEALPTLRGSDYEKEFDYPWTIY